MTIPITAVVAAQARLLNGDVEEPPGSRANAGGIGNNGTLPWLDAGIRLPTDLKWFRHATTSTADPAKLNAVVMGRLTWESIPNKFSPLANRLNCVISRNPDYALPPGVLRAHSLESALEQLEAFNVESAVVIGGVALFEEAVRHQDCAAVHFTEVDSDYPSDASLSSACLSILASAFVATETSPDVTENGVTFRLKVLRPPDSRERFPELPSPLAAPSGPPAKPVRPQPSASDKSAAAAGAAAAPRAFGDSSHAPGWLPAGAADALFAELRACAPALPAAGVPPGKRYPLTAVYYGAPRKADGALALDEWGQSLEAYGRVLPPPPCLAELRTRLLALRGRSADSEAFNTMVVNYYVDGVASYVPAHQDSENSISPDDPILMLSLGAARTFCVSDLGDVGKRRAADMNVVRRWRVRHGDLFALGPETNRRYCHAVPAEDNAPGSDPAARLRISVVVRSTEAAWVAPAEPRTAVYATGKTASFSTVVIREGAAGGEEQEHHLATLVAAREAKRAQQSPDAVWSALVEAPCGRVVRR